MWQSELSFDETYYTTFFPLWDKSLLNFTSEDIDSQWGQSDKKE